MQNVDIAQAVSNLAVMAEKERRASIVEFFKNTSDDPEDFTLVNLGRGLMFRGMADLAEVTFALAAAIPHQKPIAEYERAVLWALQNKLTQAIDTFRICERANRLSSHQMIFVSRQYARNGDFDAARSLLDRAVIEDPSLHIASLAELQFVNYLERFPARQTFEQYEGLRSHYRFADYETVVQKLREALSTRTPFSIIRIGDGEGIHIRLSTADESDFCALYNHGRAEIHRIWYAGTTLLNRADFIAESIRVQAAYANADCLGMLHDVGLQHEFIIGSPRGIPALNNMVRLLHQISSAENKPAMLCDPNIHRKLLLNGDLVEIIRGRQYVGLISCYDQLPGRLQSAFGIGEVELFRTSGEFIARQSMQNESGGGDFSDFFMSSHFDVCRKLEGVRPGELYLVTGGIWGRLYCDLIKRRGAIAIEIGSVADIWMNVGTRLFSEAEQVFSLSSGPSDDYFSRIARLNEQTA